MDNLTAYNAIMQGFANAVEWRRKFLEQWNKPLDKQMQRMAFAMMPPKLKEAMKQANPQIYQQVVDYLKGE